MKTKININKYRRTDGTPVRTHTRKIDIDIFKPENDNSNENSNKENEKPFKIDNDLVQKKENKTKKEKKGIPRNKTIRDYADISLYESIGRYKVGVGKATNGVIVDYSKFTTKITNGTQANLGASQKFQVAKNGSMSPAFMIDGNANGQTGGSIFYWNTEFKKDIVLDSNLIFTSETFGIGKVGDNFIELYDDSIDQEILFLKDTFIDNADFVVGNDTDDLFVADQDGEVYIFGVDDGVGQVVCIKADGNLGTCTDQPDAGGACSCS